MNINSVAAGMRRSMIKSFELPKKQKGVLGRFQAGTLRIAGNRINGALSAREKKEIKDSYGVEDREVTPKLKAALRGLDEEAASARLRDIHWPPESESVPGLSREMRQLARQLKIPIKLTKAQRKSILRKFNSQLENQYQDVAKEIADEMRNKIHLATMRGAGPGTLARIAGKYLTDFPDYRLRLIAHQESNAIITAVRKNEMTKAGATGYEWRATRDNRTRKVHEKLSGKIWKLEDPPVISPVGAPERRGSPGEDFFCRCRAVPVFDDLKKAGVIRGVPYYRKVRG